MNVKELGRVVGYCPSCHVAVGEKDLQAACTRCGQHLTKQVLSKDGGMAYKQTLVQSAMARYYPLSGGKVNHNGYA